MDFFLAGPLGCQGFSTRALGKDAHDQWVQFRGTGFVMDLGTIVVRCGRKEGGWNCRSGVRVEWFSFPFFFFCFWGRDSRVTVKKRKEDANRLD